MIRPMVAGILAMTFAPPTLADCPSRSDLTSLGQIATKGGGTCEYGLPIGFETISFETVRWVAASDPKQLDAFAAKNRNQMALDLDGDLVFFAPSTFMLNWTQERSPEIRFTDIKTNLKS